MDIEMTPVEFAVFFLKANILLFVVTVGASALAIFPYTLHLTQVMNNMALDIANRNYITDEDAEKFLKHLTSDGSDDEANLYAKQTFRETDYANVDARGSDDVSDLDDGSITMGAGQIVFSDALDDAALNVEKSGYTIVTANVKLKDEEETSLILSDVPSDFDPLTNLEHTKEGLEDGYGDGKLVQRGNTFTVDISARYKLTGAAFGFFLTAAIPMTVSTNGITTQYYQYDAGALFDE